MDSPYLEGDDTLNGNVTVQFISLIAYHRILELLKTKKINDSIIVKGALP